MDFKAIGITSGSAYSQSPSKKKVEDAVQKAAQEVLNKMPKKTPEAKEAVVKLIKAINVMSDPDRQKLQKIAKEALKGMPEKKQEDVNFNEVLKEAEEKWKKEHKEEKIDMSKFPKLLENMGGEDTKFWLRVMIDMIYESKKPYTPKIDLPRTSPPQL